MTILALASKMYQSISDTCTFACFFVKSFQLGAKGVASTIGIYMKYLSTGSICLCGNTGI